MSEPWAPRPYQELIRDHIMEHHRCAIWADPGLGKTSGTLSAIELLWLAGSNYWPALVVAPLRVARGVWPAEVRKWNDFAHLKVSAITGTEQQRISALRSKADIYTVNFENLIWLSDVLQDDWPFKIAVIDEATRLAGFRLRKGTKQASALAKFAKQMPRIVELTGTPALNGLQKLWGQLWFLDGGRRLERTYTAFKSRYFEENAYSRTLTPRDASLDRISERCSDICLTLRAKDWFDIRAPVVRKIEVELPSKARAVYRELERQMYYEFDSLQHVDAVNAAALSAKCLQLASGSVIGSDDQSQRITRDIHDAKLLALDSLLEELGGAPLLVGYWWKRDLARIKQRYKFAREIKTQQDEDDWNAGKIQLALGHYQNMGHGLSLQHGGHHMCHFSRWWNAEFDEQWRARLGPVRQMQSGYDRAVFEYELVAKETVDELVSLRHTARREVHDLLADKTRRTR